jgi:hypothetical protein
MHLGTGLPGRIEQKRVEGGSPHGDPEPGCAEMSPPLLPGADLDTADTPLNHAVGDGDADCRQRPRGDEPAAELLTGKGGTFEYGDAEPSLGGNARSGASGGTGPDDDHVVVSHEEKNTVWGEWGKGRGERGGRVVLSAETLILRLAVHTIVVYTIDGRQHARTRT